MIHGTVGRCLVPSRPTAFHRRELARGVFLKSEDTDDLVASSAVTVPGTFVGIASTAAAAPAVVAVAVEPEQAVDGDDGDQTPPPFADSAFVAAQLPRLPSLVPGQDPREVEGAAPVEELVAASAFGAADHIALAKLPAALRNAGGDAVAFEKSTVDDFSKRFGGVVDTHPWHAHNIGLDWDPRLVPASDAEGDPSRIPDSLLEPFDASLLHRSPRIQQDLTSVL